MLFTVKQYSYIRGRTCIFLACVFCLSLHASLLSSGICQWVPCDSGGYVWLWGEVVWWGCKLTCSVFSHLSVCLLVALLWNQWPPTALGVSFSYSLPCGPVAVKSHLPQLPVILTTVCGHSYTHLLCLPVYDCSPYYLHNKLRFQLLDESCSYFELWLAL